VHDAGKNFTSTEFKQLASSMSIKVREVPVEAHNSVGKVERYHGPLRRAYEILREELKDENIDREMILQMAVKAVNDSAGPDGIVPTLLVFGAYPRMTEIDPLSPW
jgi:di/tripeptidase